MRLHNFFVQETIGDQKEIILNDRDLFHQLRNVLRCNVGSRIILLDNTGFEYVSEVASFTRGNLGLHILEKRKSRNIPEKEIILFQSLIKKDRFEWILEKGTEIGVSRFVPLLTERSEKKNINFVRGKKILKEASEQSGRGTLPLLGGLETLERTLAEIDGTIAVAFHLDGKKFLLSDFSSQKKVGIFIGPEGGWSDKELKLFHEKNIPIYSLGNQTLRAETASICAAAFMLLNFQ